MLRLEFNMGLKEVLKAVQAGGCLSKFATDDEDGARVQVYLALGYEDLQRLQEAIPKRLEAMGPSCGPPVHSDGTPNWANADMRAAFAPRDKSEPNPWPSEDGI